MAVSRLCRTAERKTMTNAPGGPIARIIRAATRVEAHEIRATVLSFLFVFLVMAAYYLLRPLRDAMASDWSNTEISFLWNLQLVVSTVVVTGPSNSQVPIIAACSGCMPCSM